jgi:hypothetical protein
MAENDTWITAAEATRILSESSGREITSSYIRYLARSGKVDTKEVDRRTKLYNRRQVKKYVVKQQKT